MPSFLKTQYYRSPKMLKVMRLFPCSVCGADDSTIVGAHSNNSRHGKGRGIKAHDIVAALCQQHHAEYDSSTGEFAFSATEQFLEAVFETMRYGFENGIFEVAK